MFIQHQSKATIDADDIKQALSLLVAAKASLVLSPWRSSGTRKELSFSPTTMTAGENPNDPKASDAAKQDVEAAKAQNTEIIKATWDHRGYQVEASMQLVRDGSYTDSCTREARLPTG